MLSKCVIAQLRNTVKFEPGIVDIAPIRLKQRRSTPNGSCVAKFRAGPHSPPVLEAAQIGLDRLRRWSSARASAGFEPRLTLVGMAAAIRE
jgi:hypothetical protein